MKIITIVIFLSPWPKLGFRPLADRLYRSIARLHTMSCMSYQYSELCTHAMHTQVEDATSDDASIYTILHVCEPNQCLNYCVLFTVKNDC